MREKPKDNDWLLHMIEAIDNIFEFVTDRTFDSRDSVEWIDIIGMRHILVHGYYQIKDEIIWATIETDLLPLKSKLQKLITHER